MNFENISFADKNQIFKVTGLNGGLYDVSISSGQITQEELESKTLPEVRFDSIGRAYYSAASKFKIGDRVRLVWTDNKPEFYKTVETIEYKDGEFIYNYRLRESNLTS